MGRTIKWSRDLHLIRDRAASSRTETWSRKDIEHLFNVGRASAQTLMKAIGEVETVGGAHFIERTSLLDFLEEMIAAPSVEAALKHSLQHAAPAPSPKPLRISLPQDLRHIMMRNLPANIQLSAGRLEITGESAERIIESLFLLAQALQNDLTQIAYQLEPRSTASSAIDAELRDLFASLREKG